MENELKKITYLLACLVATNSRTPVEVLLHNAYAYAGGLPTSPNEGKVTSELMPDIEEIYKAYPTKCPVSGSSTGKCTKDKQRIKALLKTRSKESILAAIKTYLDDCAANNRFIKNFSTLLNNLPEDGSDEGLFALSEVEPDPPSSNYR